MAIGGVGSNLNYFLLVPEPENNELLDWVGVEGFETDEVDPDQAYEGTNFKFSVSYTDPLDNPPVVPQVWIDLNDKTLSGHLLYRGQLSFSLLFHAPAVPSLLYLLEARRMGGPGCCCFRIPKPRGIRHDRCLP